MDIESGANLDDAELNLLEINLGDRCKIYFDSDGFWTENGTVSSITGADPDSVVVVEYTAYVTGKAGSETVRRGDFTVDGGILKVKIPPKSFDKLFPGASEPFSYLEIAGDAYLGD